ncbi:hypothetical protein D1641_01225 [Colidextribacter sp. OB.20]|uniref:hypothetical protein n=1 Tax=Colidextribacter sp. OB.20 TaxID=2304568 RepID=UPI0013720360|nr:hypothetical protein [Colidextribacter sp. OB.20]NBI08641.1 hypothetical protein [Colidextribacter sp. OB.20]
MDPILKAARVCKQEVNAGELALINAQALRPLSAEEVFTFRLAACDNQVDRDNERFTEDALKEMADLFVGRPVLMDHQWSARSQTARIYAGHVEENGPAQRLILRCYMPRTDKTRDTITALEGGILRECSVGVAVRKSVCSICGANQTETLCQHRGGREYEGKRCWFDLDQVADAYEVSLCAVPSQPEAGAVKSKRYGGQEPQDPDPAETGEAEAMLLARAMQEQEEKRYGGMEE